MVRANLACVVILWSAWPPITAPPYTVLSHLCDRDCNCELIRAATRTNEWADAPMSLVLTGAIMWKVGRRA
eukprot:6368855-Prymnesium_polylepis.2